MLQYDTEDTVVHLSFCFSSKEEAQKFAAFLKNGIDNGDVNFHLDSVD